ncbi:uncharacterized protein V1518DRAFT_414723 [Limtongia smithiae]|uniref:uncharacterized protein n=1 Tax=Limtongia smithiae TaxID=1125753 RepID=UPI0034CF8801
MPSPTKQHVFQAAASGQQSMQRQILQHKLLEARTSFASPTDNLMSPCTAKLQAAKNRHYIKSKPQLLSFSTLAKPSTDADAATATTSSVQKLPSGSFF